MKNTRRSTQYCVMKYFISRIVYILLGRGVMFGREGLLEQITPKQTFKSRNNGFNHKEKDFFIWFSEEIM